MLLNTVVESKTSPETGQAIHSPIQTEEGDGSHPWGNVTAFLQGAGGRLIWGFLHSTRETQCPVPCSSNSEFFPWSLVSWRPRMQSAIKGKSGTRRRKLLHFPEGQISMIHAAGHFPCRCSTKSQCNQEKKMVFSCHTMPQNIEHNLTLGLQTA